MNTNKIIDLSNIDLTENYSWVDRLLEEKYNLYSLTQENVDDFVDANLFIELYSNIDAELEELDYDMDYDLYEEMLDGYDSEEFYRRFNHIIYK